MYKFLRYFYFYTGGARSKEPEYKFRKQNEMWVQSLTWEDPLKEGMVAHFSVLAWWIPWTEAPGGLHSIDSQQSDMTEAT